MIDIKSIQEALASEGRYSGAIDGIAGPMTRAAINAGLANYNLGINYSSWGEGRLRIAFMQAFFRNNGIETGIVDGYSGPQTLFAFEQYKHLDRTGSTPENWRDKIKPPKVESTNNTWPRQNGVSRYYGRVGENQATLELPYRMKIAWNKKQTITKFSIHEKVHDSALRVFKRIESHYSPEDITKHGLDLFAGCLNVRKMRGGSSYSMHSWGIAIDFDSVRNAYRWGRDRAYLDHPECVQFWEFWEEEGWLSLGRAKNFDWMHCQAARL